MKKNTAQSRSAASTPGGSQLAAGALISEVCRQLRISEATFHRWRTQYGRMKADAMKCLSMKCL